MRPVTSRYGGTLPNVGGVGTKKAAAIPPPPVGRETSLPPRWWLSRGVHCRPREMCNNNILSSPHDDGYTRGNGYRIRRIILLFYDNICDRRRRRNSQRRHSGGRRDLSLARVLIFFFSRKFLYVRHDIAFLMTSARGYYCMYENRCSKTAASLFVRKFRNISFEKEDVAPIQQYTNTQQCVYDLDAI